MKILVINCGSSSLKYQLIDMETENVLAKGNCEKIGLSDSFHRHKTETGVDVTYEKALPTHLEAVKSVLESLTDKEVGVIASLEEINAVGHRIVQGGSFFKGPAVVTEEGVSILNLQSMELIAGDTLQDNVRLLKAYLQKITTELGNTVHP